MTVRHRQRKGAKSGFFLYAREKAFSKPQLFPPKPPEDSLKVPNNPTRPASFRPSTAPLPAFFAAKGGFFAPNARRTRLFARPNAPFCPGSARFLPGGAPGWRPGLPRFCPGPRRRRTPPGPRKPRVCGFFARPRPLPPAVRRPNTRGLPSPPPKPPRRAPPARPLPPPAARRSARRPAEAQPWGWKPRLPRSAFPLRREEVCDPWGDQIPGHDG